MRKTPFPRRRLSLDEYLAMEEASPVKHEFVAGEVYAMSGVTLRHNIITLNLVRRLHGPARATLIGGKSSMRTFESRHSGNT